MKKLLNKSWFTGIVILGLILIIFLINFWVLSMNLTWSYHIDNILTIPMLQVENDPMYIFAYILKLVFYISIIPIILAVLSLIRKNSTGFILAGLTFLGLDIALVVFKSISSFLPFFASILIIINIILILVLFTLVIMRKKTINSLDNSKKNEISNKLDNSKIPLIILVIDIVAIGIFITTFFIPLYTLVDEEFNAVLINVLFTEVTYIIPIIAFFVDFIIFIGVFLHFTNTLSYYLSNKEKFINQSKKLINSVFIAASIFFIAGLVINIYMTIQWGDEVKTISYIPLLLMSIVMFVHAFILGKYRNYNQVTTEEKPKKFYKFESLLYTFILTAVTVFMLFLKIIKIDITSGSYNYFVNLTGFDILRDYAALDSGYRMAAYLLFVMLISISFCLIITITSYLSKSKLFYKIIKFTTSINIFFVFIIAMSGYYFQIAREINKAIVVDIATFYGYTHINTATLDYAISTDAIYALIASVFVLIVMFARKVFDREDIDLLDANLTQTNKSISNSIEDEPYHNFDPCYSFTELDSKIDMFNLDLKKRKALAPKEVSLNGLVNFIVEYARNSRLHLSYDTETIATFVAGLGASKLTILQGMSGTGKTSLPKIFSEAIYGNCDIIEVESSWKDKNELLGYYNEFSMKYTPKKFTLALYKAALNQEIFTFILLDEMNLSRIEYYFSDFLSLMENEEDKREIKLVNIKLSRNEFGKETEYLALENGHTLKVPQNIWFVGTANRDESTFVISDKVYDRAHTMNFTKRAPKVRNYSDPIPQQYYDYKTMNDLFNLAKEKGDFDAENNSLVKNIETLLAPYNISFGNRILKQIEDFVNIYKECFVNDDVESEAIEKILLSKVVSKLEVKTIEDKEKLVMEFEKLNLYQCADFIKHLDED